MDEDKIHSAADSLGFLPNWAHNCHGAALTMVRSGVLGPDARVARGWCEGVSSQHSWIAIGNPYDKYGYIIDPTYWCYAKIRPLVLHGQRNKLPHQYRPHGSGYYWEMPAPTQGGGDVIELDADLSSEAQYFLSLIGPCDIRGWHGVAKLPVQGWPAKEIITAMYQDARLRALIPIDIVGMVTDINPGEMYF